jgi:hypothetical protein
MEKPIMGKMEKSIEGSIDNRETFGAAACKNVAWANSKCGKDE